MRKKIKQLMNKEEGFTLVELLAVIVILGIIVAIAIPSIGNVISRADTQATTAEEELVIDAARLYVTTNGDTELSTLPNVTAAATGTDHNYEILVTNLEDLGYLEDTSENIVSSAYVTITEEADATNTTAKNYTYSIINNGQ